MGKKIRKAAGHMWEVLIPVKSNRGKQFSQRHHGVWKAAVLAISGGLTILQRVRGYWLDEQITLSSISFFMLARTILRTKRETVQAVHEDWRKVKMDRRGRSQPFPVYQSA